jgi:hypothetical protein
MGKCAVMSNMQFIERETERERERERDFGVFH